ncbi:MAG: aconitase X catalytic domain-containing protein [Candidatus Hydrothermarchaeota archaeon]|nr:aconitase X catalytic domain-containing protein [Candidatus Hydrothermarchaeota archaeon]
MHLTKDEEKILQGEEGEAAKKAMELLVVLGDIYGAEKLIDVASAQVSGVSYATIGDAGLDFLEDWASKGAKSRIFATINPAGIDLERWRELGFKENFAKKQLRIVKAYEAMGMLPSCTCAPYLIGNLPHFGEHIAWAESSSVVFANSVLGARTNRESAVSALASALLGKTPYCGLHLEENRKGTFTVEVEAELRSEADYSAMGYYVSGYEGVPVFKNISPSTEELKILSAALGVGTIDMFQIQGITPESSTRKSGSEKVEKIEFGREELKEVYEKLNSAEEVDAICIGCPHCSIAEILKIEQLKPKREVWAFTARQNKPLVEKYIKNKKIKVIYDTCMVVSPLRDLGIEAVGVNSAKAAFYCANLSKLKVRFDSLENLLK